MDPLAIESERNLRAESRKTRAACIEKMSLVLIPLTIGCGFRE
jgi:hypothetical protein